MFLENLTTKGDFNFLERYNLLIWFGFNFNSCINFRTKIFVKLTKYTILGKKVNLSITVLSKFKISLRKKNKTKKYRTFPFKFTIHQQDTSLLKFKKNS